MTHTARDKLNAVHLAGSIGLGALAGIASGSVLMFLLVAAALIAASVFAAEIRAR